MPVEATVWAYLQPIYDPQQKFILVVLSNAVGHTHHGRINTEVIAQKIGLRPTPRNLKKIRQDLFDLAWSGYISFLPSEPTSVEGVEGIEFRIETGEAGEGE